MRKSISIHFFPKLVTILASLLLLFHPVLAIDYVLTKKILGEKSELSNNDKWKWTLDIRSKFLNGTEKSIISLVAMQDPTIAIGPCTTACVFRTNFTYSFRVVSTRKFVRLYFSTNLYDSQNTTNTLCTPCDET
ncbi:hypothetical protein GOBAR_AA27369 [Gossypium barbadense]|uniref:Uncharacterized protein n=1 Tax=Gossypium barbadense TaxID=3634 RepID=A0A2P5WQJ3_GOSBA|nr:hypothetical protein GOBAR_AA27369 [Gossypium barbadense]